MLMVYDRVCGHYYLPDTARILRYEATVCEGFLPVRRYVGSVLANAENSLVIFREKPRNQPPRERQRLFKN